MYVLYGQLHAYVEALSRLADHYMFTFTYVVIAMIYSLCSVQSTLISKILEIYNYIIYFPIYYITM